MAEYTPTPLDVKGKPLVEKGTKVHWDYPTGRTEELRYEGIGPNLYASFLNWLTVAGYTPALDSLDYDPGRGRGTLIARTVSDGEPMYELFANPIYLPAARIPYFDTLTDAEVVDVEDKVERRIITPGYTGKQLELWQSLVRGQTSKKTYSFVLRETKTASKRSTLKADFTHVGEVDTPPATSAVNTLLGVIPAQEWLKGCPVVSMAGARRWKLATEWESAGIGGKWSKAFYNGTGTP